MLLGQYDGRGGPLAQGQPKFRQRRAAHRSLDGRRGAVPLVGAHALAGAKLCGHFFDAGQGLGPAAGGVQVKVVEVKIVGVVADLPGLRESGSRGGQGERGGDEDDPLHVVSSFDGVRGRAIRRPDLAPGSA
jgi:hypothetical protein